MKRLICIFLLLAATPVFAQRYLDSTTDDVTCELGTTDNAVLDSIVTNTTDNATATNQTTIIGHVDGVETLLGTIDADTSSMSTDLGTIAGAVSGTEMQVDIVSGAGAVEYTEDVATASPIVGNATMIERDDALSTVTPIEGDWLSLRGSAEGALWTQDFNSDAILADTANMDTNLATIAGDTTSLDAKDFATETTLGTLALNTSVDGIETLLTTIDADTGNIDTSLNNIEAGIATEGAALGSGVLLQGDDGLDRKNINVDATTGDVQVDVTNTVTVDGSGVTQPISAASLPLPTGASTATNQTTMIGHVDGVEGLLTTIDTDTGGIATSAASIDGKITACNTGAVTISSALPAGTNGIGKLTANSGVDIGDVDITSIVPGTGATSLGKAEDAVHASADTGVAVWTRRIDTVASSAGTSGDYATLNTDSIGRVHARLTSNDSRHFTAALSTTVTSVKAAAGVLAGWYIFNPNAATAYVQIFNTASGSVTLGTTPPVMSLGIPAGGAANLSLPKGIPFSTAISIASTTTATGSAANSSGLPVNFWYE